MGYLLIFSLMDCQHKTERYFSVQPQKLSVSFELLTDSGAVKGILLVASLLLSYGSKGTCILMWIKFHWLFFCWSWLT